MIRTVARSEIKPDADLCHADLRNMDLHGMNIRGADFWYAKLASSNLMDSNLEGSNLSYSDFRHANLRGVNFRYAIFEGSDFRYANLRGSNLEGADLEGVNLRRSILPTGETFETYILEVVPAFLKAGGKPLEASANKTTWECHEWANCPTAAAFSCTYLDGVPTLLQPRARQFVQLFDAGLIPLEAVLKNAEASA